MSIGQIIKQVFPDIAILKDQDNYSVFTGRNLPSFVKDFLIRKHIDSDGSLNKNAIFSFLDKHIPDNKEYQEMNEVSRNTASNELKELENVFAILINKGQGAGSFYELIA